MIREKLIDVRKHYTDAAARLITSGPFLSCSHYAFTSTAFATSLTGGLYVVGARGASKRFAP